MQQNWTTLFSGVAEANQKAVEAATEFNKIAARTQGALVRKQFAAFEDCLDAGSKHLGVVTHATEPQEAMKRHAEVAVELGEKLVAVTQATIEIQVQARDDLMRWMEKGTAMAKAEAVAVSKPSAPARRSTRQTTKKVG